MLDLVLYWVVIGGPVLLSIAFIFIPSKDEDRGRHMKWRWGIIVFGIVFSVVAWIQQTRVIKASKVDRDNAIEETAKRVAKEVKDDDLPIIKKQSDKIDALQRALDRQGKDVTEIGQSPFLSGKNPVRVEVTNPPQMSPSGPSHRGHLTITEKQEISTRDDFPYRIRVVVQSDIEFPSLSFALHCTSPIGEADGHLRGGPMGTMLTMDAEGVDSKNPFNWVFSYASSNPPFGPSNPLSIDIYAAQKISCMTATTD